MIILGVFYHLLFTGFHGWIFVEISLKIKIKLTSYLIRYINQSFMENLLRYFWFDLFKEMPIVFNHSLQSTTESTCLIGIFCHYPRLQFIFVVIGSFIGISLNTHFLMWGVKRQDVWNDMIACSFAIDNYTIENWT